MANTKSNNPQGKMRKPGMVVEAFTGERFPQAFTGEAVGKVVGEVGARPIHEINREGWTDDDYAWEQIEAMGIKGPYSEMGLELLAIRGRAIAEGMKLLNRQELDEAIAEIKGRR